MLYNAFGFFCSISSCYNLIEVFEISLFSKMRFEDEGMEKSNTKIFEYRYNSTGFKAQLRLTIHKKSSSFLVGFTPLRAIRNFGQEINNDRNADG